MHIGVFSYNELRILDDFPQRFAGMKILHIQNLDSCLESGSKVGS
jgi:hypothetical protein